MQKPLGRPGGFFAPPIRTHLEMGGDCASWHTIRTHLEIRCENGGMTGITLLGAKVEWSDASDGQLGHKPRDQHDETCCGPEAEAKRNAFHPGGWLELQQVHGPDAVAVTDTESAHLACADAAVTKTPDVALGIQTADCGPIALASPEGVVGAVHAGWKGLKSGVIAQTAKQMRDLGATTIKAALGPCIHAECYEFTGPELDELAQDLGDDVIGTSRDGTRALDMIAATRAACEAADVELEYVHEHCTACSSDPAYFSWRARKDSGRQVMIVWQPA